MLWMCHQQLPPLPKRSAYMYLSILEVLSFLHGLIDTFVVSWDIVVNYEPVSQFGIPAASRPAPQPRHPH